MAKAWVVLMLGATGFALLTGHAGDAAEALLSSGEQAVHLLLTLLAGMTLWGGLMEILSASGDVARLGRVFRRTLRPLFRGVTDDAAWDAITLNLSANLLGLGNAATPAGIEAAKRLSALGQPGLEALAMLLALNNAGFQLIPTTVITLRQSAGAAAPADIWGMTLLVSGSATAAAVGFMLLARGGERGHGRIHGCGHRGAGRRDRAARGDVGL